MSNVTPFRRGTGEQPDLTVGRAGGMVVIALASPAAGAGCTMLAAHIAVQAGLTGDGPVGVLDTDPKGALFQWWNRRQGKVDAPAYGALCDMAGIALTLDGMRAAGARLCVIDTAAGDAVALAPIAALADLVVVPSDADADAAGQAAALGRALPKQATVAFVINCRGHSGGEDGNALAAMSGGGGWPAGTVQHANAYAIAMTAGRSVIESQAGSDAAKDIAELWTNLRGILVAG
jgi:chromosome partitioning protein